MAASTFTGSRQLVRRVTDLVVDLLRPLTVLVTFTATLHNFFDLDALTLVPVDKQFFFEVAFTVTVALARDGTESPA